MGGRHAGLAAPREKLIPARRRQTALDLLVLSTSAWVCHFFWSAHFGLYEDDWWRIPLTADLPLRSFVTLLARLLLFRGGQGRPLHDSFIYLFSFVGWRLGGLIAMYVIAYLILALNTTLLYFLLGRISSSSSFALCGALAFVVFPADTTRAFLTHGLGLQPSFTFLLLALHAYLSRRRALAYVFAAACLLCYETFFPVFLAAPLLTRRWDKSTAAAFAKHCLALAGMLAAIFFVRKFTGEQRIEHLDAGAVLSAALRAMALGPWTVLTQFFRSAAAALTTSSATLDAAMLLFAGIFSWRLHASLRGGAEETPPADDQAGSFRATVLAAFLMLLLAYPLALTVAPDAKVGRSTRVHAAAALGAAMLAGVFFSLAARALRRRGWRLLLVSFAGSSFALLAGSAINVQADYRAAWTLQQQFWTQFIHLSPPLAAGQVFLFAPPANPPQIHAFSWTTPLVLERLFRFPESWQTSGLAAHWLTATQPPPRVFLYSEADRLRYCAGAPLFSNGISRDLPFYMNYDSVPAQVRRVTGTGSHLQLAPACNAAPPAATVLDGFAQRPIFRILILP